MNVEDIRGFLAVVDYGRVGAAADELGISQSALTRRVQRVEASLGARLFERTGHTLHVNSRGTVFAATGREMLRAYESGRDDVARLMDPERGTVRLDFMHSLGTWLVPDLIKSYRELHPHVDIRLHQGAAQELVSRVENGESDLALVGPRPNAALAWHQIKVQRLGLAVPEGHWAAHRQEVDLAECAAEPFIGMLPGYGTRMLLDALAEDAGFSPHLVFESMELTTVAGLVAAGLGVALLPLDDPYLQVGSLVPLTPPAYRELGLVWRAGDDAPPVQQFREFIRA